MDAAPLESGKPGYRWWPEYERPRDIAAFSSPAALARDIVASWLVALPFAVPAVARATGISFWRACVIPAIFSIWVIVHAQLHRSRSRVAFHLVVGGGIAINTTLALALPVLSSEPKTPLWCLAAIYACINAAAPEYRHCLGVLAIHVVFPLLTVPFFLAAGADPGWAIAGPSIASAASAIGYFVIANHTEAGTQLRAERDAAQARVRELEAGRQTRHLARELHDSVGSALSLAAMYGDIFERLDAGATDTDVPRLAAGLKESARAALADLRGVLGAVAPDGATLSAFVASLRDLASRIQDASGVRVAISSSATRDEMLDGALRLAVVRAFQEATNNAIRHGAAKRVDVELEVVAATLRLTVRDDGKGIEPAHRPGRGIAGLRQRASDLGGDVVIAPREEGGTSLTFSVPLPPPR